MTAFLSCFACTAVSMIVIAALVWAAIRFLAWLFTRYDEGMKEKLEDPYLTSEAWRARDGE